MVWIDGYKTLMKFNRNSTTDINIGTKKSTFTHFMVY